MRHLVAHRFALCLTAIICLGVVSACGQRDASLDGQDKGAPPNPTQLKTTPPTDDARHPTRDTTDTPSRSLNETLSANLKRVGDKVDTLQRQGIKTSLKITTTTDGDCIKPVAPSITHAGCFDEHGLALVISHKEQGAQAGFINTKGDLVIPMVYDVIMNDGVPDMGAHDGLIALRKDGKWGFMDTQGQTVIDFIYADVRPYSDGHAAVLPLPTDQAPNQKRTPTATHRWGYINKKGQAITEFKYAYAYAFSENLAQVISEQNGHSVREFIDTTGKVVIDETITQDYTDIAPTFARGMVAVVAKNSLGYMDSSGKLTIPLLYQVPDQPAVLPAFSDSKVTVKTKKGLTLCINTKNQQVACE